MAAKAGALLLTDDSIFPVRAGLSAIKNLESEVVVEDEDVVVITHCGFLGNLWIVSLFFFFFFSAAIVKSSYFAIL